MRYKTEPFFFDTGLEMQMLSFVKVKPSYANEVLLRLLKGETIFYQCQPYRKCIVNGAFIHFLSLFFLIHINWTESKETPWTGHRVIAESTRQPQFWVKLISQGCFLVPSCWILMTCIKLVTILLATHQKKHACSKPSTPTGELKDKLGYLLCHHFGRGWVCCTPLQ